MRRKTVRDKARAKAMASSQEDQGQDKLHLLYALPGLELGVMELVAKINKIRAILGQGPWTLPTASAMPSSSIEEANTPNGASGEAPRRKISVAGRKRIIAATKKRWAAHRAAKALASTTEASPSPTLEQPKRKYNVSRAGLKAMRTNAAKARAVRARNVKLKQQGKTR